MRKLDENIEIQPHQRLYDMFPGYFGDDENKLIPDTEVSKKFRAKIHDLRMVCKSKHLDPGEALLMINNSFGYRFWGNIPYGQFDTVKTFLINNAENRLAIIDPEFNQKLKNYKPEDDKYLLEVEKIAPGFVNDLLTGFRNPTRQLPRTQF